MKTLLTICTVLAFAVGVNSAQADTGTIIDMGGELSAHGISGNNSFVAAYKNNPRSSWSCYIYKGKGEGACDIDMPGAGTTEPEGIDGNNIVGHRRNASGVHGFLYNWKTDICTTLDAPWAKTTEAYGISGNNIVGAYVMTDSIYNHGVIYNWTTKTWTTIKMPGASSTGAYGINGSKIVGVYVIGSIVHGFIYDYVEKTWTTIDMPGARETRPHGIYGNNIVGEYQDAKRRVHGFFYDGKSWTTIDVPNAEYTVATGISGNKIVGKYLIVDIVARTSTFHSFFYTISENINSGGRSVQWAIKKISQL
jgi:hypothetical protein